MFKKFTYSLLGLLLLPSLFALGLSLYHLLVDLQIEDSGRALLNRFALGAFSWLVVFLLITRPVKSYILAHELTHLLAAWLTGVPAGQLTFHRNGGSVEVARTTLWISLAPYFIPFYSLLILGVHVLAQLWWDPARWVFALPFLLGFSWSYHLCFTLYSLSQTQSDIRPYGPLGAYPIIAAVNLLILCLTISAVNAHPFASDLHLFRHHQQQIYIAVYRRVLEWVSPGGDGQEKSHIRLDSSSSRLHCRNMSICPRIDPTDAESRSYWKQKLTPEQFRVCVERGTEHPFSGEYTDTDVEGLYRCVCCDAPLFRSDAKFHSGCGWPSYFEAISESAMEEIDDFLLGYKRTEVRCASCGAHLGHVFGDGPRPTGLRYCINSVCIRLST